MMVVSVYSPGRRRKKNAVMIMSVTANRRWEFGGRCCATYAMRRITEIGTGLTLVAGGSCFFQAASMRWTRKSVLLAVFKRGSEAPTERNV